MTTVNNSFDYEHELNRTGEFLKKYQGIWSYEVLNEYPQGLTNFKPEWLDFLRTLSPHEQWQIECRNGDFKSSLSQLFNEIISYENIPQLPREIDQQYPSWAFQKVSQKKEHEIKGIVALLSSCHKIKGSKVLDIGGGAGHLGRILALYHGAHVTSIDTNSDFQERGKKRLGKYPKPETAGTLKFINHHFSADKKKELSLMTENNLSIGLHTCGPLALEHLNLLFDKPTAKAINFGCCYQKLNLESDIMLSSQSKVIGLKYTKYALTLATRGNHFISENDFELKKKVKLYRAALHLYLAEKHNINLFESVGSSPPRVYRSDFSVYAKDKLPEHLKDIVTESELNLFYQRSDIQEIITNIYLANIIRWQFSRVLEKYLLLDRAQWLREQGVQTSLYQVFDSQISPRNIALVCNIK